MTANIATTSNPPNWKNRTIITGDNLFVLRGLNTAAADLVYLDPPFNSKKEWNAPIGSQAAGAAFRDTWTLDDIDQQWHEQIRAKHPGLHDVILAAQAAGGDTTMAYLIMMAPRLLEIRRVLKPTGSLFLHCDPTESHGLKMMLDTIFGRAQFRNEIAWCYPPGGKAPKRGFHRKHDIILYYADKDAGDWNPQFTEMTEAARNKFHKIDDGGRRYKEYPGGRQYLDETPGRPVPDWWIDLPSLGQVTNAPERTGYPTQKPVALLERIIRAASNEGDIVLDPFAGCATTAIAAERLGRQWAGIDISPQAAELIRYRLDKELGLAGSLAIHRTDIPRRTDQGRLPAPATYKNELYGEQAGICQGCGEWFRIENFHIDHIIPRKHGGTDHRENLQLLCGHCNSRKGTGTMSELMTKLLAARQNP